MRRPNAVRTPSERRPTAASSDELRCFHIGRLSQDDLGSFAWPHVWVFSNDDLAGLEQTGHCGFERRFTDRLAGRRFREEGWCVVAAGVHTDPPSLFGEIGQASQ